MGVVPRAFVEITPFSGVLLCLPMTLLFLWLGLVFRRLFVRVVFIILWLLQICRPKLLFVLVLKFLLDFNNISIRTPSYDMSRKSISVWMYLCRAPWYFRTKCRSESLIPSLVRKVWKILVNFRTAWLLSCRSVVHLTYWSS
jgi:hypothetical protein